MRTRTTVGDIFEIPLSDGRKAFGQYVFRDKHQGPLIQVFDLIVKGDVSVEEIINSKPLFPPVITGLSAAYRIGLWKKIGYIPIKDFKYPLFISTLLGNLNRKPRQWFLWDGKKYHKLGTKLPKKYQKLEMLVVYSPYDIPKRIETGERRFEKIIQGEENNEI